MIPVTAARAATMLLTLVSCSPGMSAPTPLIIDGVLTADYVQQLIPKVRDGGGDIVIRSSGGEIGPALRLAQAVRDKGRTVIVTDYCLSACASYVFAMAKHRVVRNDAIVGFHGTATSRMAYLKQAGEDQLAADYAKESSEEKKAYQRAGLSVRLLEVPLEQVGPVCFRTAMEDGKPIAQFATSASVFVPSRASLAKWGVRDIQGFWPADQTTLSAAMSNFPAGARVSVKLEPAGTISASEMLPIPRCGLNLIG